MAQPSNFDRLSIDHLRESAVLLANVYLHVVLGSLLFFTSIFMIFLVLIQRGRGGGLAGALGGGGGGSAFGAKAGDTFTWVTYGASLFWFLLCLLTILLMQGPRPARQTVDPTTPAGMSTTAPETGTAPATGDPASGEGSTTPPADPAPTEGTTAPAETPATDSPAPSTGETTTDTADGGDQG